MLPVSQSVQSVSVAASCCQSCQSITVSVGSVQAAASGKTVVVVGMASSKKRCRTVDSLEGGDHGSTRAALSQTQHGTERVMLGVGSGLGSAKSAADLAEPMTQDSLQQEPSVSPRSA